MSIRLNKLLATRGIGARRKCDILIAEGRVRVNGEVVREAGTTVEEQRDRIEVNGKPLPGAQRLVYYALNKPVGVITTLNDPEGRRTIAEFLPRGARVFPVGRLDADTSGLLLLTNDGELAHRLMHPRYGVEKIYRVRLSREPSHGQLARLARGVEYEPHRVSAPARARRIDPGFDAIMIELAIHEGRFRQVRRMCEAIGLDVTGLHRVAYGPVRLGPLARGMYRELSEDEVARLQAGSARPNTRPRPGAAAAPGRPATARTASARPASSRPGAARPAPARPPARPAPPAREAPEDDEDREDTWIPGGGFAPERTGANEDSDGRRWPARATPRRGDADWQGGKKDEAPATPRTGTAPWHAPEYRRGPRASGTARPDRARRPAAGGAPPAPGRGTPRPSQRNDRAGTGARAGGAAGRGTRPGSGRPRAARFEPRVRAAAGRGERGAPPIGRRGRARGGVVPAMGARFERGSRAGRSSSGAAPSFERGPRGGRSAPGAPPRFERGPRAPRTGAGNFARYDRRPADAAGRGREGRRPGPSAGARGPARGSGVEVPRPRGRGDISQRGRQAGENAPRRGPSGPGKGAGRGRQGPAAGRAGNRRSR